MVALFWEGVVGPVELGVGAGLGGLVYCGGGGAFGLKVLEIRNIIGAWFGVGLLWWILQALLVPLPSDVGIRRMPDGGGNRSDKSEAICARAGVGDCGEALGGGDGGPAGRDLESRRAHYVHEFSSIVGWIRLGGRLRYMADMSAIVVEAAQCLGGSAASARVAEDIRSGALVVPVRQTIQVWQVRLDLAVMAYRRETIWQNTRSRHLCADASPQASFNFLCCREDTMVWTGASAAAGRNALLGGFGHESRSLPVSTLGLGRGRVSDKSANLLRSILLEAGGALGRFRVEMKTWLADQSVEKAFGDIPATLIPDGFRHSGRATGDFAKHLSFTGGVGELYMWPFCVCIPDHLHIMFNPLERAITKSGLWSTYEDRTADHVVANAHRCNRSCVADCALNLFEVVLNAVPWRCCK